MSQHDGLHRFFARPAHEAAPLALSDEALVAHVRPSDPRKSLSGSELRALKLVAVVIYAQATRLSRSGTVAVHGITVPTTVPVLAEICGLSSESVARALNTLVMRGALRFEQGGYRISEDVLAQNVGVGTIRWDRILDHMSGNAAALLAAWALGQILVPPWQEREVPLQKVEQLTAYSRNRARAGINLLVEGGMVLRRDTIGGAPLYRFSSYALGQSDAPPARSRPSVPATDPASQASQPKRSLDSDASTAPSLCLEIAGRPITLGPNIPVDIRLDEAGREVYRIGKHLRIVVPASE